MRDEKLLYRISAILEIVEEARKSAIIRIMHRKRERLIRAGEYSSFGLVSILFGDGAESFGVYLVECKVNILHAVLLREDARYIFFFTPTHFRELRVSL